MSALGAAYSDKAILLWLKIYIDNLNDFCGVKEKLTDVQIIELANIIYYEYYYLNIAEIALFFIKYKTGTFGEFYGVIDPLKITSAFIEFTKGRRAAIDALERKDAKEQADLNRLKWAASAVTYEQYLEIKKAQRRAHIQRKKQALTLTNNTKIKWRLKLKKQR